MRGEPIQPCPKAPPRLLAKQKADRATDRAWWALRRLVLARDGHACRACGSTHGLEAHHVVMRSLGGKDVAENLIALCSGPASCHKAVHGHVLTLVVTHKTDPQKGVRFRWAK